MLPHLVFDDKCIPTEHYKFVSIVDHVLLETYVLLETTYELYLMPSCMFACQDLIRLKVYKCLLQPPSTFKGFKSLRIHCIENVSLDQEMLENFTSCSLLEGLTLKDCHGFQQLKIDAPNLRFLLFTGDWFCRSTNSLKSFADLPHIQRLSISNSFTKYLAAGSLLQKLPLPCLHLNFFTLSICYNDLEDFLTALCLLKSSPALKELNIFAFGRRHYQANAGKVNYWVDENQSCSFTHLRHVKIYNFLTVELAIDFVNFLLLSSPALETMSLYQDKSVPSHDGFDLAKTLLRFPRASLKLEIILL
ncbi:putative FBD domain, leucine-rich repeat domain, L domain-containing protein [Rosa chinensis]|uniref:Putative FBD domain, leucine-rich repeat domain, L domain-containing protein n=1 Tax=Rosa chinensis TaxID=74649 RepID=A0A2P6PXA8_ROSCH|nr:putative FBD domain, leucine-rich repeat domain, L domain-containing protein [Rosa chinensis]